MFDVIIERSHPVIKAKDIISVEEVIRSHSLGVMMACDISYVVMFYWNDTHCFHATALILLSCPDWINIHLCSIIFSDFITLFTFSGYYLDQYGGRIE